MKIATAFASISLLLCLSGSAAFAQAHSSTAPVDALTKDAGKTTPFAQVADTTFRIGVGDVLHISAWHEEGLTQTVTVRPDGKITLPLISELSVLGRTPTEVQDQLVTLYSTYLNHPQITVSVVEIKSQVVYITGEIQRPGEYPITGPTTLLQLIARAGGLTPFAKKKQIYLLHAKGQRIAVNYRKLISGQQDIAASGLVPGDTVIVP